LILLHFNWSCSLQNMFWVVHCFMVY